MTTGFGPFELTGFGYTDICRNFWCQCMPQSSLTLLTMYHTSVSTSVGPCSLCSHWKVHDNHVVGVIVKVMDPLNETPHKMEFGLARKNECLKALTPECLP